MNNATNQTFTKSNDQTAVSASKSSRAKKPDNAAAMSHTLPRQTNCLLRACECMKALNS